MWDPGFEFESRESSVLRGYHRAACLLSKVARGTNDQPGLVVGLDEGGECHGVVYTVNANFRASVIEYLTNREIPRNPGIYEEAWVTIRMGRTEKRALAFIADKKSPSYLNSMTEAEKVNFIVKGHGAKGTSIEYFQHLIGQLHQMRVAEPALEKLTQKAEAVVGRMILCGDQNLRALAS